jgi:hypothetical protein
MIYDITLKVVDGQTSTTYAGAAVSIQTVKVVGQVASEGGAGISDGDKGDITVSAGGTVWTVDGRAITAAKLFEVGASKLLGRHTGTAGDVQEISVDGGLEFHGGQLRRAALTGAVTAAAGSGTTVLAQSGAIAGQFFKWDGTSWVPATISFLEDVDDIPSTFPPSSHTHTLSNLTESGATTGQVAQWNGTAWVPATPSAGKLVNAWVATSTAVVTTTVAIPLDDTIPQISEGAELISVSVTPSSATNKLKVTFTGWSSCNGVPATVQFAAFVGSGVNAVASGHQTMRAANSIEAHVFVWYIDSFVGTQTLSVRGGLQLAGTTFRFLALGAGLTVYFGATDPAVLLVEEIAP